MLPPPLPMMHAAPAPETVIDGVPYLYFGGTGYLGLAANEDVIEAGCAALRKYGVHSATSRSRIGTIPPVREVEERAAACFGTEDAFYFGSGYVANHLLVAAHADGVEAVFVDEAAHYSVQEAAAVARRPVSLFASADPADLARAVAPFSRVLVLADAVNPSTGNVAPVRDWLAALQGRARATLVLDDAHGVGVLGPHGRGLLDELGLWPHVNGGPRVGNVALAMGATLAKALGGFGGIIPGTATFVDHVRRSSGVFGGASAPASAVAGSTAKALEIVASTPALRHALERNVHHLRTGLRRLGLDVPEGRTAHVGVVAGDAAAMQRLHAQLKDRGIYVPYVGAYTGIPPGGVLRFAVFATHTPAHIDRLLAALRPLLDTIHS